MDRKSKRLRSISPPAAAPCLKTRYCIMPICKGKKYDLVHKFPMDRDRAIAWLNVINLPELKKIPLDLLRSRSFICSIHFRKEDYKNAKSRSLNKTAIPTLYLSNNSDRDCDQNCVVEYNTDNINVKKYRNNEDDDKNKDQSIDLSTNNLINNTDICIKPRFIMEETINDISDLLDTDTNKINVLSSSGTKPQIKNCGTITNEIEKTIFSIENEQPLSENTFTNIDCSEDNSNKNAFAPTESTAGTTLTINKNTMSTTSETKLVSNSNNIIFRIEIINSMQSLLDENFQATDFLRVIHSDIPEPMPLNYIWLRDHCRCKKCYNHQTYQRRLNITDIPLDIKPNKFDVIDSDLMIEWSDQHISTYNILNLYKLQLESKYNLVNKSTSMSFWNKDDIQLYKYGRVKLNDYFCQDGVAKSIVKSLIEYGIAFVENVPANLISTEMTVKCLFPIQKTLFGEMWSFNDTNTEHSDTAYTKDYLGAHTDNTYFNDAAGLQIFHCIKHDNGSAATAAGGAGGETLLIDGFKVLKDFKNKYPNSFERLCKINVPAEYIEDGVHHEYCAPIIKLNSITNEPEQIRFNLYDRSPMNTLAQSEMTNFYKDLHLLTNEIQLKQNEWWFKLNPGTVLFFDNWRVLHGRAAYTGHRQMAGCYVSRTDFMSVARTMGIIN